MTRNARGQGLGAVQHLGVVHHLVHQVDAQRFLRIDGVAGQAQAHGLDARQMAIDARHARGTAHAVGDLGQAELGRLARDAHVGQMQQIDHALAQAPALDRANDRLEALHAQHFALPAGIVGLVVLVGVRIEMPHHAVLALQRLAPRLQIVAGREGAVALGGQDADLERTVALELVQRLVQLLMDLRVQRIDFAIVDRKCGDLAIGLVNQRHLQLPCSNEMDKPVTAPRFGKPPHNLIAE